jgi:MarR family transcriptional regulator, 2-MHQ and catechol-resistance regulon repressor
MAARARPAKTAPAGPADSRLADPRITAIGMLIETVGGLNAKLAVQYAEHDLAPAEFEVLVRIARTPGQALRMSDLAAQTLLTTSGITRVVDRLERDHLVERRACPTDRRGSLAAITAVGLGRLDAVLPGHLELVDKWFISQLSQDELDSLMRSLRIIRDGVRPEATAGAEL